MSQESHDDAQMALVVDLARLLKKHGSETFETLARNLRNPQLALQLGEVLSTIAAAAPKTAHAKSGSSRGSADRLDRLAQNLARTDTEAELAVRTLVESWLRGEPLPRLRDLKAFAERNGLAIPTSRSRRDAAADVLSDLLSMHQSDVGRFLQDLVVPARPDDRSLEGWSRIIERSRAEIER